MLPILVEADHDQVPDSSVCSTTGNVDFIAIPPEPSAQELSQAFAPPSLGCGYGGQLLDDGKMCTVRKGISNGAIQ
jgi:hypothetical protein